VQEGARGVDEAGRARRDEEVERSASVNDGAERSTTHIRVLSGGSVVILVVVLGSRECC
jgi:hypothetical protein